MDRGNQKEFDEKSMIIEQDRIVREQKKKRHRKKKYVTGIFLLVLTIVLVWYLIWGKNILLTESSAEVTIQAKQNQEIVYASIQSIYGNEMTYTTESDAATVFVPVGTTVTTRLGTETTFSRLKAGDGIALIMEEVNGEQVIVEIYIIE